MNDDQREQHDPPGARRDQRSGTDQANTERPDSEPGSTRRARGPRRGVDHTVAELAAQRRELERLDQRLDEDLGKLDVIVRSSAGLLAETVPRVSDLTTAVNTLTGRVDELAGASPDDDTDGAEPDTGPYDDALLIASGLLPDPGHQVDWHLMSAEQAQPVWEALAAWVAAVVCGRLGFTRAQLPDCWALHPDVVAELSWAHQLHRAYAGAKIGPTHLAEWHTRWLPHLRARLEVLLTVDVLDPRPTFKSHSRDEREQREELRPRCRPGHYHHLVPVDRDRVEAPFMPSGPRSTDPTQRLVPTGMQEHERLWITGLISGRGLETVTESDRRARDERRARAQLALDLAHGYDPHAGRPGPPERPRYLLAHPGDDHPDAGSPATRRSYPQHWLTYYFEAAHADLARRRHREQHRHQPRVDVTLGHLHPVPATDHGGVDGENSAGERSG